MKKVIDYTQTAFYIIQYNTRKLNAIIKRNQIHRIKVYVMLMAIVISAFNNLFAIENSDIPYGEKDIHYRVDDNSYIIYNNIRQRNTEYFYTQDGEEYTAYCIDLGLNGAEYGQDGHYVVNANNKVEDRVLNNIILNCYPYKSVEELGLATVDEAKFASQFAIWCYTSKLNLDIMKPVDSEYSRVDSCIRNIYSLGTNEYNSNITIDYNESNQYMEEIDGHLYYVKDIEFVNINNIKSVELKANDENIIIISGDKKYKVFIPVDYVDNLGSITKTLNLNIVAKENVALIGESNDTSFQRVAITLKDTFNYTQNIDLNFESNESKIIVKKVDKDTCEPIEGVIYEVSYENGEKIDEFVTNENGEFEVKLRNENNCVINIIEKQEREYYYKDNDIHRVEVNTRDNKQVLLTNEKKKGTIEIVKKTKEYNKLTGYSENTPLSNVSFYIYNEEGDLVDNITTAENGKATTKLLESGKYYIEEYKTVDGYKLLDEKVMVEISFPGENVHLNILNDNIDIPKILPITGK